MRYLSLCSGIESATLAWAPLGWQAVAFAEVDPFACAVLAHHYPTVPNLGDITQITQAQIEALGPIDVVVFGFPCQDLSVAGKRKGLKGERSGLFFDAMRIVRWTRARWTVVENVPGLFTTHQGRDFACVVGDMVGCDFGVPSDGWQSCGVAVGPEGCVEWSVLDAQWHGLAQRRKRVFLVRDTGDWASRPPLLLERESLQRDIAKSRETRQRTTGPIAGCSNGGGPNGPGRTADDADSLVTITAPTLDSRERGGGAGWGTDFICDGGVIPEVAWCLQERDGKGADSDTKDGHLIPVFADDLADPIAANQARTYTREGTHNFRTSNVVAFDTTQITHPENRSVPKDLSPQLCESAHAPAVAFKASHYTRDKDGAPSDTMPPLSADADKGDQDPLVLNSAQVRRLTPQECEILQGVPKGFTRVPYRGKPASDGPRYRALGNSFAVPVVRWIGQKIDSVNQS